MKKIRIIAVTGLLTLCCVSASYAIAGIGFHWGFDYSMSMKDVTGEKVNLPIDGLGLPNEVATVIGEQDFFRVSRTNWKPSVINFGGKAYIDFLPFLDEIGISCNFGLWQYDGALEIIDVEKTVADGTVQYTKTDLTLGGLGMNEYIGLSGTPYAKLHFDATVRKQVLNLWLIKFNAGAGVSAHFATPLLSSDLIERALGTAVVIDDKFIEQLAAPGNESGKAILDQIIKEAMGKPVFGGHLVVGVKMKLPVIPAGLYVDGKFMFPFTSFDDNVGKDNGIKGYGFLVNTGISLSI